ncbi:hypothetical protein HPB49_024246 [Dermacentor silvarum]|uniref:Uncharacterized protein n=1 Tax=Dermacentor silvarum TaxID=543639 RepID=A0ACB8D105_DERSI|nr:hypothetical protein HPB49_024246 [Dermacentor silvarum]
MHPLALALLTAALSTASADEPREWYSGNVSRLPDYHFVNLQPVNAVGKTLLFACSAASQDPVRFRWHVQHPAGVDVSRSTRARSLEVEHAGRVFYVRDSLLRVSSLSPHDGTVNCTVLVSADGASEQQVESMSANYSVLASASVESCSSRLDYCPRDRASCSLDQAQGLTCRCFEAFPSRDPFHGVCFAPVELGKPCVFDHECEPENSWCLHQVCACRPLTRPAAQACEPVARLGEPCQTGQCAAPYSSCKNGRCGCQDHSDDVDGVCVPDALEAFGGGETRMQHVRAFGPMRTDGTTVLMMVGFGVVLGLMTLCYTLKDLRYRSVKATTAISADRPLSQAHAPNAPTS